MAALEDDLVQHPRHSSRGEGGIHFQRHALLYVGIHHTQHPNRAGALYRIMHRVQCPFLIRRRALQQRFSRSYAVLPTLVSYRQPRLTIHPMQTFVVYPLAQSRQQYV